MEFVTNKSPQSVFGKRYRERNSKQKIHCLKNTNQLMWRNHSSPNDELKVSSYVDILYRRYCHVEIYLFHVL